MTVNFKDFFNEKVSYSVENTEQIITLNLDKNLELKVFLTKDVIYNAELMDKNEKKK